MRNRPIPIVPGVKRRFDKKWRLAIEDETPVDAQHLGPCWLWIGARSGPYGTMRICGSNYPVHRISVALYSPDTWTDPDLVIDHLCMNKMCVSPRHLEPVSYVVNAQRYMVRPDDPGPRVLTTEDAATLQAELRATPPGERPDYKALALKWGLTPKHVRKVELGRYWDFVGEDGSTP